MKIAIEGTMVGLKMLDPTVDGRGKRSEVAILSPQNSAEPITLFLSPRQTESIAARYGKPVRITVDFDPAGAGGLRQLVEFLKEIQETSWDGVQGERLRDTLRLRLADAVEKGEA